MPSTVAGAAAPASATVRRDVARTASPPNTTSTAAAPSSFATRRLASVNAARSAAPDRPTPDAPCPGRPRSSTSASAPTATTSRARLMTPPRTDLAETPPTSQRQLPLRGVDELCEEPEASGSCRPARDDEADPSAGFQQRRRVAVRLPQLDVGRSDELPAPRRRPWIDAAELPGQPDGAGRHRGAGLVAARHPQPLVALGQVGEARGEPAERDPPRGPGVRGDHVVLGEPGGAGPAAPRPPRPLSPLGRVAEARAEPAERDPPRGPGVRGDHVVLGEPGEPRDLGEVRPVVGHRDLDAAALRRGRRVDR